MHARRLLIGAAALLLAAPAPAPAQQVTIEALLSAPFPSELVAAPSGGRVAWVMNDEGIRNIWVADAPDYRGRAITSYTRDDGQEITGLAFTPDGATLLFVRGAAANRQGENPNPSSDPAGAEQAVWRVAVAGGAPVRIGVGGNVAISPGGERAVFTRGGQLWSASPAGGEPKQLIRARGGAGSHSFSPDGSRLAFVSNRGDHGFIGVYTFADSSLLWLTPSVDRDSNPVWSPDGRRIAFIRQPASSELLLFKPLRETDPWSILVADAATGAAREVWRADEGRGSAFSGIVAEHQLMWGAGDRLVFPWEKTGWKLLYSVPASGGAATLLTPGDFEVEYATLGPDGRAVLFNSNQGDIDRRDLWSVGVAGGPPRQLTRGAATEWAPTPTADGGALAFLRSDGRTPAHPVIQVGGGEVRELAPGTRGEFPAPSALVEPVAVMITAADGKQVPAQLFLPPGARAGDGRPAAIFVHGGSRRQMLLGFHYSSYYHNAYAMSQYLASRGYVALSLNYRSGTGYGLDFREALNYGASGASEFYDVLGAGLYLRGRPEVDPGKVGIWGGSYGGYLTAMALSRASDLFAAGVDIHGVHDWNVGIRTFVPSYNTVAVPTDSMIAFMASPMSSLDGWRSPVLVIHGDDDRNVAFAETVTLVEALRDRGVEVEQLVFPDEVHGFLSHENWLAAYRATADFFRRKLGR